MIPRLKGAITHSHGTKLPGEDGEDGQQTGGPYPVQRQNPSEMILETLRPVVGGTDLTPRRILLRPVVGGINPTPRRIPLGSKSRVSAIIDLEKGEKSDPLLYPP